MERVARKPRQQPSKPARKFDRTTVFIEKNMGRYPLPPEGEQLDYYERLKKGRMLVMRVSYGGSRSWRVGYYVNGKPRAKTIGRWPETSVAAARKAAFAFDPMKAMSEAEAGSFKEVAEAWLKRHVAAMGLLSDFEYERMLGKYVYPQWGARPFTTIRRGEVNALLDRLQDKHGKSQADAVLSVIRGIMRWFAANRDENYISPIVEGMQRDKRTLKERSRTRTLREEEIRALWNACTEMQTTFGALVKVLLLTAQRQAKVATMRWQDIDEHGVWTVPKTPREKGHIGKVQLPPLALGIIRAQPRVSAYVFTSRGGPFSGFSQGTAALNRKLKHAMQDDDWTLHDLRRTARTLMAKAGVQREDAERTLGHVMGGVEDIYNRFDYFKAKTLALQALANAVERILNPPPDNVVPMPVRTQQ
jgi:integrase